MQQQFDNHIFTGMQRDLSISKHPANYLFDAQNIRITARDGNTLLSITNERGPKDLNVQVLGTYLGHCTLNQYLVVFSTTSTGETANGLDYITRIDLSNPTAEPFPLYNSARGNLKFSVKHKIEAISSYENKNIQKVYWTDGYNQPRMINIAPFRDNSASTYTPQSFDFVQELALNESVVVEKVVGAGEFPPGMIQYAFTYYNKYGQESNIFYTTKLYPISHWDRGGSPEDKIANQFRIKVSDIDTNFDYIRIYSILRTSINSTPIVKRLQDIDTKADISASKDIQYIDDGTQGEDIDPTELLYKGGEFIQANTIEQKDGTLFLGNLSIVRPNITRVKTQIDNIFHPQTTAPDTATSGSNSITSVRVATNGTVVSTNIPYINNIDISGFKSREVYRIGIQFQYKTGRWSEPFWVRDYKVKDNPSINNNIVNTPQIQVKLGDANILSNLISQEYKRARLLMAQPTYTDRTIICQGIANSTLFQKDRRHTTGSSGPTYDNQGPLYGQSSWIFRPKSSRGHSDIETIATDGGGYISTNYIDDISGMDATYYSTTNKVYPSPAKTSIEIGAYLERSSYEIDQSLITIHSPEISFEDQLLNQNWSGTTLQAVGEVQFSATLGDIDIQTSSPTIGSATGFIHRSIRTDGDAALISGLYYEDYIVDDQNDTPTYGRYSNMHVPVRWPVYLWHKNGSLNNDVSRAGQSAILQKKKISNYHIGETTAFYSTLENYSTLGIELFSSDQTSIIKINGHPYMGNIDTLVAPKRPESKYFVGNPWGNNFASFFDNCEMKLALKDPGDSNSRNGFWILQSEQDYPFFKWVNKDGDWKNIGDQVPSLCETSEGIRIKYKSTPHLVALLPEDSSATFGIFNTSIRALPLVEVDRVYNADTLYGGRSSDALKSNIWIPISDPVTLAETGITLTSNRGDTYFQRYECLKTYAFTQEDTNQVVDIASFICETHVNIDGRYDRNRGQSSNLNMSPINFNLLNPVYSQMDNFFNYRILDDDYYNINSFPNQITWTKEKQAGADVDLWTNVTLASTYDMDGSKGQVQSLNTWQDQLYCFQDKGISNILFNSRVQIPTSDGVPIEITNSYKVDGYRYITDGTGCTNKYTIKETATGIYFIDSVTSNLYHIGEGVSDIATTHNMATWFKNNEVLKTVYDDVNHDVYLIGQNDALCYSEVMKEFTSRMSYNGVSLLESYGNSIFTMHNSKLYEFGTGEYNMFFGTFRPWLIDFISNGVSNQANNSTLDKVFDNLEYRMDRYSKDTTTGIWKNEHQKTLDYIRVFNEYQDTGYVDLSLTIDRASSISNLKKKFRVWRVNIPRNKVIKDNDSTYKTTGKRDRIRNTWCNIELGIKDNNTDKVELHDMNVIYYM